jgi:hypothetical protein
MTSRINNPADLFNTEDQFEVWECGGRGMMGDIINCRTGEVRRARLDKINDALVHYGDRVQVEYRYTAANLDN